MGGIGLASYWLDDGDAARRYVEHWRLADTDRIAWTLRDGEDESGPVVMTAEFEREVAAPDRAETADDEGTWASKT